MYYINTIWALINPEMVLKSRSLKKKKYKVTQKKKPLFENEKKKNWNYCGFLRIYRANNLVSIYRKSRFNEALPDVANKTAF